MGNVTDLIVLAPMSVPEEFKTRFTEAEEMHGFWWASGKRIVVPAVKEWVEGLPWHDWGVDVLLQVFWQDDFTHDDDSFHGREQPYSWVHETWIIYTKRGQPRGT